MVGLRRLAGGTGLLLWAVLMAPALALLPAALFDAGPSGPARLSAFPAALALLDPYVWECARNSLAVAAGVTVASYGLGVGMGRLLDRRRFPGRRPLALAACAGMAVPPAFGAIGLRWAFGPAGWLAGVSAGPGPSGGWTPWVAWFWVASASAAPLVGLATLASLRKTDPAWEDAAVWSGATRRQAWRQVVWPTARPEVARSLGVVFGLTLLEPGAPIVLGLRRTLGFQLVRSAVAASEPGELSRAAVLAVLGTSLAVAGRVLIGWWGGKPHDPPSWRSEPPRRPVATSWPVASLTALGLLVLVALAWLPWGALASASLAEGGGFSAYRAVLDDPLTRGYLVNAAVLGCVVLALDVLLAGVAVKVSGAFGGRLARVSAWPESLPPLAVGVGALALPGLLAMAAGPPGSGPRGPVAAALLSLAGWLDPEVTPGLALVLAVAAVRLALLTRSVRENRGALRPSAVDAAVTFGARPGPARRRFGGGWSGATPGALALTFSLAATGVSPALILCPTAETRPVGPAVLLVADAPGRGLPRAAALGTLAVAVNLGALALAVAGRRGRAALGRPGSS